MRTVACPIVFGNTQKENFKGGQYDFHIIIKCNIIDIITFVAELFLVGGKTFTTQAVWWDKASTHIMTFQFIRKEIWAIICWHRSWPDKRHLPC